MAADVRKRAADRSSQFNYASSSIENEEGEPADLSVPGRSCLSTFVCPTTAFSSPGLASCCRDLYIISVTQDSCGTGLPAV
jgi:hypothetical protein